MVDDGTVRLMLAAWGAGASLLRRDFLVTDMADPVIPLEDFTAKEELSRYAEFAGALYGCVCPRPFLCSKRAML
jgi:hypothetical protein